MRLSAAMFVSALLVVAMPTSAHDAAQAFQHNADLLFSGMMPACGSANIPDCLFSAVRYALARLSHRCSSPGYDEPAILSYAISSFCPTSADGLQTRRSSVLSEASRLLEWRVWREPEGFSRNQRASWYQSTPFGRRRRVAQQRGAIAAALHRADGALCLLERRAQRLCRGGWNQREQQGERGDGPHGER